MVLSKLLPKQTIIYIVITVISLGLGLFGGYTFCKRAQYKGVINQQTKDAKAVVQHQEKKDEVDTKVQEHVEALKGIPDTSGCLDAANGAAYLERLQRADGVAKSSFN